ncbi:hypothetical protein J5X07_02095 [Actinomyces bowdenii]|uniref:Uncharacterized protein n=1 Tax=Actinomyces bowdenii TaxID=131109 RepID=A0A3P1V981_9ACTO|nr:hypothetical protein [Actinomyces bowdenii]MBO3723835.1 hypothetical protein [Actinomyces bowdenii]RRD29925.1 hypothetical protein EII10_04305 [Actinomyces bowdenii]
MAQDGPDPRSAKSPEGRGGGSSTGTGLAVGISVGCTVGLLLFMLTDSILWTGSCVASGIALGTAFDHRQ